MDRRDLLKMISTTGGGPFALPESVLARLGEPLKASDLNFFSEAQRAQTAIIASTLAVVQIASTSPPFRNFTEKPNADYLRGFGYQGRGQRTGSSPHIEGLVADFKKELTSFGPCRVGMGGFGECP